MPEAARQQVAATDAATLDYPLQPPAPDGSLVEVAPGVLWARMPMPMKLDHINVYLLRGERGWTIVDTGLDLETTRTLWQKIAAAKPDGLPLEALICTHWHHDHAGSAAWLTEHFDIPLYMTHGEYYVLQTFAHAPPEQGQSIDRQRFYTRSGMPAERLQAMFNGVRSHAFSMRAPHAFRRLRGGDELTVGTRRWRVVIGEGHSPEHACLYDAEAHLLLAGDQLLPRITSNVMVTDREPEANPLKLWLDSLDRLDALAPDTLVLPSHQEVFHGVQVRTQQLREHHQRALDGVRADVRARGPLSAFEAMQTMFPKLRGPFDEIMALGETTAHLAWLHQAGEFTRTLDASGIYRFGLASSARKIQ